MPFAVVALETPAARSVPRQRENNAGIVARGSK
jgi:hypothetical protein